MKRITLRITLIGVAVIAFVSALASNDLCWVTKQYECTLELSAPSYPFAGNCCLGFRNCCTGTGSYPDSALASTGLTGYTCQEVLCSGSYSGVDGVGNPFTITGSKPTTGCPASGSPCS